MKAWPAVVHPELDFPVDRDRLIELGRRSLGLDGGSEVSDAEAAIEGLGAIISEMANRQVERNRQG